MKATQRGASKAKVKPEPAIDALPESTDSEDGSPGPGLELDVEDSGDGACRGDILPDFSRSKKTGRRGGLGTKRRPKSKEDEDDDSDDDIIRASPPRRPTRSSRESRSTKAEADSILSDSSDSRTNKRLKRNPQPALETVEEPDFADFLSSKTSGKALRKMTSTKYGSTSTQSKKAHEKKNQVVRVPKKMARKASPPPPKFIMPPELSVSQTPSKPDHGFKSVDEPSPAGSTLKARFRTVPRFDSSPLQKDNLEGSGIFKDAKEPDSSPLRKPAIFRHDIVNSEAYKEHNARRKEPEISPAHSVPGSPLSDMKSQSDTEPVCPMCDAPVDPELVKSIPTIFMSIRQQQAFCRRHKLHESKSLWRKKGYPEIDWPNLEKRFSRHKGHISKVLDDKTESHYRNELSKKVEAGQSRTMFKSSDSLTPGYYGFRGLRLMSEYLVASFSAQLRKRSVEDRLVAARGHTTFVQAVLVPELAMRLIMEDMDVGANEARTVLEESVRLGEILNEEVKDVVEEGEAEAEDGLF